MNHSILSSMSYVDIMKQKIGRVSAKWGSLTLLAKQASCQPTRISRIVSGKGHLTLEQAHRLVNHWKLNPLESEYFLTLVQYERAKTEEYKLALFTRLEALRSEGAPVLA